MDKVKYLSELSDEQISELKREYLYHHYLEVWGREPTEKELKGADQLITYGMLYDEYYSTPFYDSEFECSSEV